MITKFGKRFLINYLAGNADFSKKEIALGIGSTAPNAKGNDTRLEFEFYRLPATISSIDIEQTGVDGDGDPVFSYKAVYQATIPQDVAGVATEIALYPGSRSSRNNFDDRSISLFENNILWTDSLGGNPGIQINTSNFTSKIGENMVYIQAPASTSKEYNDKIQSVNLSSLFSNTSATTPDFANIINLGIEITANAGGTTKVYFDGLRINDEDTFDPTYGMISRSVLTGGDIIYKTSGRQVDIEYKLQLGF